MKAPGTHRAPGRLFVVEGIDGSGKSTQISLLQKWLESEGYGTFFSEWNSSPLVRDVTRRGKKKHVGEHPECVRRDSRHARADAGCRVTAMVPRAYFLPFLSVHSTDVLSAGSADKSAVERRPRCLPSGSLTS
jgi:hypothetical protein